MSQSMDYTKLSKDELVRLEKAIAQKHMGHTPWLAVFWSLANFAVWLSLWPLVILGYMPLWLGFIIATINIALSYLPSHEAQHDIIARPGEKLRWLNELIGWVGSIPLVIPYSVLKATHLEHHKHTNDPELDPDYYSHADGPWHAIWRYLESRQPNGKRTQSGLYVNALRRIGREDLIVQGIIMTLAHLGFLIAMAWAGYAIEAALLWWIPGIIALTYIVFFLAWAPHHPGKATGRYRDTRAWRSKVGNLGSMGMQFHIVHHLYPRIPLTRTPRAYWELRPILEARGCNLENL